MNFSQISGHLPGFAHFQKPGFDQYEVVKTQYLCGFAGFLPTFPLLILNYYDRKFKNI